MHGEREGLESAPRNAYGGGKYTWCTSPSADLLVESQPTTRKRAKRIVDRRSVTTSAANATNVSCIGAEMEGARLVLFFEFAITAPTSGRGGSRRGSGPRRRSITPTWPSLVSSKSEAAVSEAVDRADVR